MSEWEIEVGGQAQGPFSEAGLVGSIERGLPATTRARRVGTEDWLPIGAHPPFAEALGRAARSGAGYVAPPPPAYAPPPVVIMQASDPHAGGCSRSLNLTCGLILAFPLLAILVMWLAKGCAAIVGP